MTTKQYNFYLFFSKYYVKGKSFYWSDFMKNLDYVKKQ